MLRAWCCSWQKLGWSWSEIPRASGGAELLLSPMPTAGITLGRHLWVGFETKAGSCSQADIGKFGFYPWLDSIMTKTHEDKPSPSRCLWHFASCVCFLPPPCLDFAVSSGCRSLSQAGAEQMQREFVANFAVRFAWPI